MHSKTVAVVLLPITIVSVILGSLFFPFNFSKTNTTSYKANLNTLLDPVKQETQTTPTPKNPTPENVQILGVEDTKESTSNNIEFSKETLYSLINSYRLENDLNKLFINRTLEESARRKVADMIENEYFNHTDQNQNESWYLFQAVGYHYKHAGENLSTGINTPWKVFTAWQNSPQHNFQLLKSEYLDMGIAADCSETVGRKPYCVVVLHLGAR